VSATPDTVATPPQPWTEQPVVVLAPGRAPDADETAALRGGSGLVVLGSGPWHPAVLALLAAAGLEVHPFAPRPGPLVGDVSAVGSDLIAFTRDLAGTAGAAVSGGVPFLHVADGTVVGAVAAPEGAGRVAVVAADVDEVELARNLRAWAAGTAAPSPSADRVASANGATDDVAHDPAWLDLAAAVHELQPLQAKDGSVAEEHRAAAQALVRTVAACVERLAPRFPHDAIYLDALVIDLRRWADEGVGVPDFLDSLVAFDPAGQRVDGLRHLVVFPMYTQNGTRDRRLEAVVVEVRWPDFVADLEARRYSNPLFVPIRFVAFTSGYDTNSAVLFPETVAMRAIPTFTWGAIFADRESARFRRVVRAAADTTRLVLPPEAERLLADQALAEETFILWDLIHDRTHMRGDLPFDPFMIKQRMPFFLYGLEELRCDLTAFREAVALEAEGLPHARLVRYAVVFDRVFRFAVTGTRVRNYDGMAGQLLFAWLHQRHVVHWTDNRLSVEWDRVAGAVLELGEAIDDLYWRSIDRPKISHWLAAYQLVAGTLTPHPASVWAKGPDALPVSGPLKEMTDAVLDDEFPLSMFHEALARKIGDVVASTAGITGTSPEA
jgi:hypothetical protein